MVTGASGFLGSRFCEVAKEDFEIRPVSLQNKKVENVDFSGVDAVLHLAGIAHRMKTTEPDLYESVNSELTYRIAREAKKQGVKHFIFVSTIKVYGADSTDRPIGLDTACNPQDDYGKSKFNGEQHIRKLESPAFRVAILRPPLIYGPGVKGNLIALMKLTEKLTVLPFARISNARTMVSLQNMVDYMRHVINSEYSGVILPADKRSLSTTELVELIASHFNKKTRLVSVPYLFRKIAEWILPGYYHRLFSDLEIDAADSNSRLGFEPVGTIEEGIAEMVNAYQSNRQP